MSAGRGAGTAVAGAVAALAALLACGGCGGPSPEDQVRALIAAGELRAEAKDVRGLLDLVADDYADDAGRDRRKLGAIVSLALRQFERVFVLVRIDRIAIRGEDSAEAALFVAIAGTEIADPSKLPSLSADLGRVSLRLAAGGADGFEVVAADWAPAGLTDFFGPAEPRP